MFLSNYVGIDVRMTLPVCLVGQIFFSSSKTINCQISQVQREGGQTDHHLYEFSIGYSRLKSIRPVSQSDLKRMNDDEDDWTVSPTSTKTLCTYIFFLKKRVNKNANCKIPSFFLD